MKKILLVLLSFLLFGCSKSYNVGLYKDGSNKDNLLAVFPSASLGVAMDNCESTIILYKADDAKNMITSMVTDAAPEYHCQQIQE